MQRGLCLCERPRERSDIVESEVERIDLEVSLGVPGSIPNGPIRTPGLGHPIGPSVPGRVGKDARAKRQSIRKTAVLVVDGRALQSLVRRVLPVVLCRAWP